MLKFNAKVGEWGPGLRFKSRIFRILLILKKGHQSGVYVPLRALFLVRFKCIFVRLEKALMRGKK